MTKINVDIETFTPYQQQMITAMQYQGRGTIQMTGKSSTVSYEKLWEAIMSGNKVTDMKLDEGTVYGSRYYTVEPVGGNWTEMEKWCAEVFGPGCRSIWGDHKVPEPARRWYMNNRKFWFRSEKDRDWFIVRWRS